MNDFGQFIPLIVIITAVVIFIKVRNKGRQTRIEGFNKKHGTNFKNELELNYYIATKLEKKEKETSKEIKSNNESDFIEEDDLGIKLKRLKKMYNDGHLTKIEFEQAKNKLLK